MNVTRHITSTHTRRLTFVAALGGLVAAALLVAGALAMGHVGQHEARQILQNVLPTTRFLSSATMAASSTLLALLLTLLGLSTRLDEELEWDLYQRIGHLSTWATVTLLISTLFLGLHVVPIERADQVPADWYRWLYRGVVALCGVVSGLLSGLALLVLLTIHEVVSNRIEVRSSSETSSDSGSDPDSGLSPADSAGARDENSQPTHAEDPS